MAGELANVDWGSLPEDWHRPRDLDELVEGWLLYQKFGATTVGLYGPGWWTYEASHELIARYPDLAWDFVMAVLKTNPDELTQATLAAGPIEDLLVAHGPYLIGRIEQKVRLEPELREVFRNVWKSKMRPDVWARLQELLR